MDQRKDPRVSVKVKVKVKKGNYECILYTANMSRGGIYVETDNPFVVGDILEISLFLSEDLQISCQGKVVWTSYNTDKSFHLPGMGIKFEIISDKDREKLGAFLGRIIAANYDVEKDYYPLWERINVSTENICDGSWDVVAIFAGVAMKETVNFTKDVLAAACESFKNSYLEYGETLNTGETILLPYEGKLKSHYVILVGLPFFYDAHGEENLRVAMNSLLQLAKEQAFLALAVPAFSLLELGYPVQTIAKICLGTSYAFLKKEIFPRKVFFYCNYNNIQDMLIFQGVKKEIFER